MSDKRFDCEAYAPQIDLILAHLRKAHSGATTQIAEATGIDKDLVTDCMLHLRREELAMISETQRGPRNARVWILGADPAVVAAMQPQRIIKKQWEPNHVRMAFECFLFGVPAALQGATA